MTPDLTEPIRLVRDLHNELGLNMVNLTMGNPYATTHVTRPFDFGKYEPDEHPFVGLSRMIHGIGAVKKAVPEWWFGHLHLLTCEPMRICSAQARSSRACAMVCCSAAWPLLTRICQRDRQNGRIDPKRVCLTCGKCGDLIRAHKPTGCVIRDSKTFMPFYKEFLEIKRPSLRTSAADGEGVFMKKLPSSPGPAAASALPLPSSWGWMDTILLWSPPAHRRKPACAG